MYVVIVFKMRDITSGSFHCFQVTKKSIYSYINLSSVFNTEYGSCTYICINSRKNHITLRHHILHQFHFSANWQITNIHIFINACWILFGTAPVFEKKNLVVYYFFLLKFFMLDHFRFWKDEKTSTKYYILIQFISSMNLWYDNITACAKK